MHEIVASLPSPDKGAELFQTYGPFFLSVVLLSVVYAFAYLLYKRIQQIQNNQINDAFLKDFRLFYRLALLGTFVSAIIAVGWWVTANVVGVVNLKADNRTLQQQVGTLQSKLNRIINDDRSRYFVYAGIIAKGITSDEALNQSLGTKPGKSFRFVTFFDPVHRLWNFTIISRKPIEKIGVINILLWHIDRANNTLEPTFMHVTFKKAQQNNVYKFIQAGDTALIEPEIMRPNRG